MKKCPNCGAQMDDESLFCTECGKPIPQGNVCPHCGASVNDGDAFCQNCGKKVGEESSTLDKDNTQQKCPHCGALVNAGNVFCENCGKKLDEVPVTPVQRPQTPNESGKLVIRWDGAWALIDTKIRITVNGSNLGEFSYKEGFESSVPITSSETVVVTKVGLYTTKEKLNLNPNENYTYEFAYHRMSGWFGFILYDSHGNELRRDKLHWGMFLLSFLLPIVGIIYAICVWKKKPASSYTAIYASLLGILISLLVSYNLPSLSNYTNSTVVVSDSDSIIVDSDSIIVEEDISDVHSEAYIKHRLQQICDGVPSTPEKTFVNKYFSESFKKLYNAVNEKYDNEYPESDMGYFGSYFWSNSGSVDDSNINSVTVLEVELITESTALATVQDYVKYGKNDELKNSKQIKLVFENDDWFIDDFNDYKSNMEEYINRTNDSETITAIGAFTDEINDDGNDSIR